MSDTIAEVWSKNVGYLTLTVRLESSDDANAHYHWVILTANVHGCRTLVDSGDASSQEAAQGLCLIAAEMHLMQETRKTAGILRMLRAEKQSRPWGQLPKLDQEIVASIIYRAADTFLQRAEDAGKQGLCELMSLELQAHRVCLAALVQLGITPDSRFERPLWSDCESALRELIIAILYDRYRVWMQSFSGASTLALYDRTRRSEDVQDAIQAAILELGYSTPF
jgi:hypothetical protein